MRESSSSLLIASARISCSVRSAKRLLIDCPFAPSIVKDSNRMATEAQRPQRSDRVRTLLRASFSVLSVPVWPIGSASLDGELSIQPGVVQRCTNKDVELPRFHNPFAVPIDQ